MCSQANEELTEGSLEKMGHNLAAEVKKFVKDLKYARNNGKMLQLTKLTFVGHSLGGLIIRSALPRLEEFKGCFHGFVSLGSPHLGYLGSSNALISAGMWFLK
jgi:triacylglycerol esterase/lipase EstA (alpha/beta hydrolase family)